MGEFFFEIWKGFAWISKKEYWREEQLGKISRKLEKVCVDFQKAMFTRGKYGECFPEILFEIGKGFVWISQKQYWWEETMGEFFVENWGRSAWISKRHIGGRKLWRNFSRNLERVGVDFPRAILAVGNYGGIFQKFGEGMRGFPKSHIGGRKLCKRIFEESWRGFAWISKNNIGGRKPWGNFC